MKQSGCIKIVDDVDVGKSEADANLIRIAARPQSRSLRSRTAVRRAYAKIESVRDYFCREGGLSACFFASSSSSARSKVATRCAEDRQSATR